MARLIVLAALLLGASGAWAADQCVACHTSAAKLQALVAAPEHVAEEGEG
jgi:hypothetical protein